MVEQNDTIYITGLTAEVTEQKLEELFGSIGIIKWDKKQSMNSSCGLKPVFSFLPRPQKNLDLHWQVKRSA